MREPNPFTRMMEVLEYFKLKINADYCYIQFGSYISFEASLDHIHLIEGIDRRVLELNKLSWTQMIDEIAERMNVHFDRHRRARGY